MTFQHAFVARRDDELGNLGREKTLQASDAFDFGNLLGHPLFERAVPCLKIGCLCRYSIVCLSQIGGALAQLIEQPHVLDGDHSLVGEDFDQFDLLVSKRPHDSAVQVKHADRDRLAQERHTEQCAKADFLLNFDQGEFRIGYNIDDLNRLALKQNSASYRPPTRLHWQSFYDTVAGREPVRRYNMEVSTFLTSDRGHIRFTKSGGRRDQRFEHHNKIEGGAADDLEHVCGSSLLLQRFSQLIQKARVLDRDD